MIRRPPAGVRSVPLLTPFRTIQRCGTEVFSSEIYPATYTVPIEWMARPQGLKYFPGVAVKLSTVNQAAPLSRLDAKTGAIYVAGYKFPAVPVGNLLTR